MGLTNKQRISKNWNDFNEIILPDLQKKYIVSRHDWLFKIKTDNSIYNYYPKGERLEIEKSPFIIERKWIDLPLKDFEEKFIILTAQ